LQRPPLSSRDSHRCRDLTARVRRAGDIDRGDPGASTGRGDGRPRDSWASGPRSRSTQRPRIGCHVGARCATRAAGCLLRQLYRQRSPEDGDVGYQVRGREPLVLTVTDQYIPRSRPKLRRRWDCVSHSARRLKCK